jgi:hypothetical protein
LKRILSNTTLYFIFIFIKIIFLLFYFNFFFSLSSFLASLLNPPRSAQTTTPGYHRSVTHATNTSRSATHNPKPPPASHPRHKHLKIGNPTTTPTAQSHPQLYHHVEIGANHHTQAEIGEQTTTPRKSKTPDEKKKSKERVERGRESREGKSKSKIKKIQTQITARTPTQPPQELHPTTTTATITHP